MSFSQSLLIIFAYFTFLPLALYRTYAGFCWAKSVVENKIRLVNDRNFFINLLGWKDNQIAATLEAGLV
jgi:hypothetical protein